MDLQTLRMALETAVQQTQNAFELATKATFQSLSKPSVHAILDPVLKDILVSATTCARANATLKKLLKS